MWLVERVLVDETMNTRQCLIDGIGVGGSCKATKQNKMTRFGGSD